MCSIHNFLLKALLILLCLSACVDADKHKSANQPVEDYYEIKKTRIKFNFDQSFEVKEIKKGTSISDVHISGIGFSNASKMIKVSNIEPIESFLVADIDDDGFEELYIITRSVGSGAYAKIIGVASNKGKGYKQIYVPEYDSKLNLNFEYLLGYVGHDSIFALERKLYRQYPVYFKEENNSTHSDGIRRLKYKLIQYENSFTLQVDKYENIK